MNKIILGTVAGVAAGYFFRKIQEKANFKEMCDGMNGLSDKTKRKLRGTLDKSLEEGEYIKDQVKSKIIN